MPVDVTLYPLPPPAPYTVGAPGASLWNPDVNVVSIDTVHPQDMPLVQLMSFLCPVSLPRGHGTSLTVMRITPMTHLLTSLTGLVRTSPSRCPLPLLGRWLARYFLPRPPMLLQGRCGLLSTCC
jgi:hypothetical protein